MTWFLLAIAAGFLNGSFPLPMKFTREWKWEHTWGMWSLWACLVLPWAIAAATVGHLGEIYRAVPGGVLLLVFLIGCGWGVGAITYGKGVEYLGMAMATPIIVGLAVASGALGPLFIFHPADAATRAGMAIIAGVVLMIVGIAVCSRAGWHKDRKLAGAAAAPGAAPHKSFGLGLIICIIAGVCGSLINYAFVFGAPIIEQAKAAGANPTYAPNAVWSAGLLGGFLVNFGYCAYLISCGKNWPLFRAAGTGRNWGLTLLMGAAWMGSVALFGIASAKMGALGSSIGFASFLGMAIVSGNVWGLATGEWKGAGGRAVGMMVAGIAILLAGVAVVGWSNTLS